MTDRVAAQHLETAIRLLEANLRTHIDPAADPAAHNLSSALLSLCRAVERLADQIHTIESK